MLENVQDTIFQIRQIIKTDENIRKLLYYGTSDALSKNSIDIAAVDDYIFLSPVMDTTREPFNKHCLITITLTNINETDEEPLLLGEIRVNVIAQNNVWELNNNKIRPIEISDRIIEKINYMKFDSSHKLEFDKIDLVILDKNITGYSITFNISEGSGLENEF